MPFTPKNWLDRPAELAPEAGETLAEWEARVAAYNTANPGALTPVNAAAQEDTETRLSAYTDSEVAAHAADTTSVHGITDAAALATDAEVATAVSDHSADTTSVHGIADTSVLATDAEVSTAVSDHAADTTAVHGIADTSALATDAEVSAAVAAHVDDATDAHDATAVSFAPAGSIGATNVQAALEEVAAEAGGGALPAGGDVGDVIVNTAPGEGDWAAVDPDVTLNDLTDVDTTGVSSGDGLTWNGSAWVDTAVATQAELDAHAADATSVHGIADTAELVASSDVDDIVVLTQVAYDAIGTPDPQTLYVVSG